MAGNKQVLAETYKQAVSTNWLPIIEAIDTQIPVVYRFGGKDSMLKRAGYSGYKNHDGATVVMDPMADHDPPTVEDTCDMIAYLINQRKSTK